MKTKNKTIEKTVQTEIAKTGTSLLVAMRFVQDGRLKLNGISVNKLNIKVNTDDTIIFGNNEITVK